MTDTDQDVAPEDAEEKTAGDTDPDLVAKAVEAAVKEQEALPVDDVSRLYAEKTMSPLSYQNLILKSYLEQSFQLNQHLTVKFRTLSAGTVEFIFRQLSHSHRSEWAAIFDEALRNHYVAASMQTFNGNEIGPDLDEAIAKGSEEGLKILEERVDYIQRLPASLAGLMYSHYVLFSERVDDFIKTGGAELGNS